MNIQNKKFKIIVGVIVSIIICIVYYYIYVKDTSEEIVSEDKYKISNQETEENIRIEKEKQEAEKIYIHISGAVNKEGVIELNKDSRICDAVEKAEGFKEDANIKDINLAYKLEDGMKIYIPTNKEKEEQDKKVENDTINKNEINNASNTNNYIINTTENKNNAKININTATQTELETLPGIGPSIALKIINYRKENGKFKKIEDIKSVNGVGENKFKNIKDLIII